MAERKFTLLELHLDDATFSANATKGVPSLGGDDEATGTDVEANDDIDEEGAAGAGRGGGKLLGVLLLLVLLAAVARALMGDDEALEDLEDLDEVDVIE